MKATAPPRDAPWLHSVDQVRNLILSIDDPVMAQALLTIRDNWKAWPVDTETTDIDSVLVDVALCIRYDDIRAIFAEEA